MLVSTLPNAARADDPAPEDATLVLPPDPSERAPVRGVEVQLYLPIPVYARPLCPRPAACILGVGGGFSVFVERRWQNGFAVGAGYQALMLAAESVYELSTLQSVGARARWVMAPRAAAHPSFHAELGIITLGNVFRPETIGPYVDLGAGGELEMTQNLAFTLGLSFRTMAFVPFTTTQDGVHRSVSPYFDVMTQLHVGILWLAPRARGR